MAKKFCLEIFLVILMIGVAAAKTDNPPLFIPEGGGHYQVYFLGDSVYSKDESIPKSVLASAYTTGKGQKCDTVAKKVAGFWGFEMTVKTITRHWLKQGKIISELALAPEDVSEQTLPYASGRINYFLLLVFVLFIVFWYDLKGNPRQHEEVFMKLSIALCFMTFATLFYSVLGDIELSTPLRFSWEAFIIVELSALSLAAAAMLLLPHKASGKLYEGQEASLWIFFIFCTINMFRHWSGAIVATLLTLLAGAIALFFRHKLGKK